MIQFNKIRSHTIPTLQATVDEYVEPGSGAVHIHVATPQPDLAFLVGFPTVPDTSDGRAHILEHLALCGSGRYPVRDPFFSMLRRSTATFMNAMTYADRTVYPFASTDRTDFFNLLDVYLDAAFFPNLDYLNFLQEGWRHTLDDGKLGYQGVVFNEMKGAFADPMRALYNGIGAALLPETTYQVISGGDPLAIPDLTHQMLKDFHASHYHPSQAVFMTAGPLDPLDIQRHIADKVLARLPGGTPRRVPQLATPFSAPRDHAIRIPSQSGKPDEYGFQLTWLLGESADAFVHYHANLLSAGLLGDASAPLKKAMESAGFGRPSRLNGHDPSARQMLFHVGMEGLTEDQLGAARSRMWQGLEHAAAHGVPHAMLSAALRDIRYSQRDTASGRMPNVLGRMLHALPVAMRGGDVMSAFDSDAVLAQLENDIADPAFFKGLVRTMLDSPARLDVTVVPDPAYFSDRAAREEATLAVRQAALTDTERARILDDAAALDAHQRRVVDSGVLPRILPSDVGTEPRFLPDIPAPADGAYRFDIASNGISYARVHYDVSALPADDWPWLQLYTDLRRDLGVAGMNYEEAGAWRQRMAATFGVNFDALMREDGAPLLEVSFTASGLREEHQSMGDLLGAHIASPRFDEHERIAFLVERMVRNRINGLAQSGNRYAALTAAAPLSPLRRIEDLASGTSVLPFMAQLQRLAHTPDGVAAIARRLAALHEQILAGPASVLCVGSGGDADALAAAIRLPAAGSTAGRRHGTGAALPAAVDAVDAVDAVELVGLSGLSDSSDSSGMPAASPIAAPPVLPPAVAAAIGLAADGPALAQAALYAPGQVNHCSIAWPAPRQAHDDAAALAVAAELLTHLVLHQALREQGGAYGGSAGYAGNAGVFSMMSYRDPRLAGTYADFQAAIDTVLATDFTREQIEEAIICVVRGLDRPDSPYDGVLAAWTLYRRGITMDVRRRFRRGVLACTQEAIKAAVGTWLKHGTPSRAAFAGNTGQDLAGLEVVDMLALVS